MVEPVINPSLLVTDVPARLGRHDGAPSSLGRFTQAALVFGSGVISLPCSISRLGGSYVFVQSFVSVLVTGLHIVYSNHIPTMSM